MPTVTESLRDGLCKPTRRWHTTRMLGVARTLIGNTRLGCNKMSPFKFISPLWYFYCKQLITGGWGIKPEQHSLQILRQWKFPRPFYVYLIFLRISYMSTVFISCLPYNLPPPIPTVSLPPPLLFQDLFSYDTYTTYTLYTHITYVCIYNLITIHYLGKLPDSNSEWSSTFYAVIGMRFC